MEKLSRLRTYKCKCVSSHKYVGNLRLLFSLSLHLRLDTLSTSLSHSLSALLLGGHVRGSPLVSARHPRFARRGEILNSRASARRGTEIAAPTLSRNDARVVAIIGWPCTLFYGPGLLDGRELDLFSGITVRGTSANATANTFHAERESVFSHIRGRRPPPRLLLGRWLLIWRDAPSRYRESW